MALGLSDKLKNLLGLSSDMQQENNAPWMEGADLPEGYGEPKAPEYKSPTLDSVFNRNPGGLTDNKPYGENDMGNVSSPGAKPVESSGPKSAQQKTQERYGMRYRPGTNPRKAD